LDNVVTSLARAICPDAKRHVERPLVPPTTLKLDSRLSKWLSSQIFPRYVGFGA
jgi:hypothetical protein